MPVFLLCFSSLLVFSCIDKPKKGTHIPEINIEKKNLCSLEENREVIGKVTSFDVLSEDRFVVGSKQTNKLVVYSFEGKQQLIIDKQGNGPTEYRSLGNLKCFNNEIYIWDDANLKLIRYDSTGTYMGSFPGFNSAILDFFPTNSGVFTYSTGGGSYLIAYHDFKDASLVKYLGDQPEEHIVLSMLNGAGGLLILDNNVLYMPASELSVHSYDFIEHHSNALISVEDPSFKVEKIKSGMSLVNNNRKEAINYLQDNSVVKGLYVADDNLLMMTEVGVIAKKGDAYDFSGRKTRYLVVDKNSGEIIGCHNDEFIPGEENLIVNYSERLMGLCFNNNTLSYELNELIVKF